MLAVIKSQGRPQLAVLKKNKKPLSPEEWALCMERGATWNHGPGGKPVPAVWKSVDTKTGIPLYITNTHRAWAWSFTIKGAIRKYHDIIKGTA